MNITVDRKVIEQALEALDYVMRHGPAVQKAKDLLQDALAQPEQEPVAWRNAALRVGEDLSSVGPDGYYDMTAEQWLDWAIDQQPRGKNSLNASPQRKPLTDDEIQSIWKNTFESGSSPNVFARAIEAAHDIMEEA